MRFLLVLLLALAANIAHAAYTKCVFKGTPYDDPGQSGFSSATAACQARFAAELPTWSFIRADRDPTSTSEPYRYNCYGRPNAQPNDPERIAAQVWQYCKQVEAQCTKGDTEIRTFDWVKWRTDPYDINKAPRHMSVDGCDYERRNSSVFVGVTKGSCKYPVRVEYVATGELRNDPIFEDVPEKCTADPDPDPDDPDDPDNVNPGRFPNIRNLYKPKYPDGILGVLKGLHEDLQDTSAVRFIQAATSAPNVAGGGVFTANIQLDLGPMGYFGEHAIHIDADTFLILKGLFILFALLAARSLIFGG
ncbi:hypothetical protein [Pulveribacter sp.]|uniref:hypothetical protein n=1 Tax=Pulveribacter sp. TaxID=2678893 RepID=UPI0028A806D3|nr:hypothetical protein [Pulveribacter sp.]